MIPGKDCRLNRKSEDTNMNQFEMRQKAYQSTLTSRALQVLLYLIDRADRNQTCFPAVPTIGRELHISISTVKRAMKELIASGYVSRESRFRERNGGQTSNLYTLFFPETENGKGERREPVDMCTDNHETEMVKEAEKISDAILSDRDCVLTDSISIYGGNACSNCSTESGKVAEKGSSMEKEWRTGKRPDKDKRDIMTLWRIWTGEEVRMIPP